MKNINFLGYTINASELQDLNEAALSKVQQRASHLYGHEKGYTVAQAWVEAVLEFLYQRSMAGLPEPINTAAPSNTNKGVSNESKDGSND